MSSTTAQSSAFATFAIFETFKFLQTQELFVVSMVSREWNSAMRHDSTWSVRFQQLLSAMAYRSKRIGTFSTMSSYRFHLLDRKRTVLTNEELCEINWSFRFKKAAGRFWMDQDPYWQERGPMSVIFSPDGTTKSSHDGAPTREGMSINWCWGTSADGTPASGYPCDFIRYSVNGEEVPSLHFSRHPIHYGIIIQSCWVVYSSFPLPKPGEDPFMEDEALGVDSKAQMDQVLKYNSLRAPDNGELEVQLAGMTEDGNMLINVGTYQLTCSNEVGNTLLGEPPAAIIQMIQQGLNQESIVGEARPVAKDEDSAEELLLDHVD
eukprot:Stramenopile-MAST_4_protein_2423